MVAIAVTTHWKQRTRCQFRVSHTACVDMYIHKQHRYRTLFRTGIGSYRVVDNELHGALAALVEALLRRTH